MNRHHHHYRPDISDWWCRECDTVTDYCTALDAAAGYEDDEE